jgi:hypothetical protein
MLTSQVNFKETNIQNHMKKLIFAVVFASIFFIASLVMAEDTSNNGSLDEAWAAINALKIQVATLQSNLAESQDRSNMASGNFVKVSEKAPTEEKFKHAPQSEHYIMTGMTMQ